MDTLRTLVLTPQMKRHSFYDFERAIVAALRKTVYVLAEYEDTVSSPSVTMHVPAVVQLRHWVSPHKFGVRFTRSNLYARDNYTCCYCNKQFGRKELTYDHVVPKKRGGQCNFKNIVAACKKCNLRKGARTPDEAKMKMHFKPYEPESLLHVHPMEMPEKTHELWEPFLAAAG